MKILLMDTYSLTLLGLRCVAQEIDVIDDIVLASSREEMIKQIECCSFDLYLFDIELPDLDGFDLIQYVFQKDHKAKILVNTVHDELWTVKRLAQSGVRGIIWKSSDISEFSLAIRSVLSGGVYLDSHFKQILTRMLDRQLSNLSLTHREIDVLRLIAQGLSTREIAKQFCLSVNTVETHRKNLIVKLGAKNSVDLVLKAIHQGMYNLLD